MAITAMRGGTAITDIDDLKAHLASLLRLEHVGLMLGAGASCSAGGQTMKALWNTFVTDYPTSATWLAEFHFVPPPALASEGPLRLIPNVEELVDTLEIALSEWTRANNANLPNLRAARADVFRAVIRAAILDPHWWSSPSCALNDADKLQHHRTILQKIVAARQPGQGAPWVFTTNYDLAIEWAAESIDLQVINGFLGIHSRRFSPQSFDLGFRNVQARGEARFGIYNIYLAKLHGSLTWQECEDELFEVPAPYAAFLLNNFVQTPAATDFGFMVMPRAAKYMQTVGFALGELLRRFSEFLARPQTCLILNGYGFGDAHINRLLRSALLNPTLQLVVYFPGFNGDVTGTGLPAGVKQLLALKNPRVTIVGGDEEAFLDKLAEHLPDPVIYDEDQHRLKELLKPRNAPSAIPGGL